MSFRRKTYDGDFIGRSSRDTEWRDPFSDKSKTDRIAPPKRPNKGFKRVEIDDSSFSEDHDKDRYLITYADLITLLLGLFIILYSISNVDAAKYSKVVNAIGSTFGAGNNIIPGVENKVSNLQETPNNVLKDHLIKVINEHKFNNSVRLEENERGITLHILGDILFSSGNAELNQNALQILDALAEIIKTLPNDIRIEGHTDDIPINSSAIPSNWHLSVDRALNTAYYLINSNGLNPEKVSIVGYSEYKPISDNVSPEGRTLNRRVDIVIINK